MRPLWLDYQRADPTRHRPGMLLLIAGVLVAAATAADYSTVAAELDDMQAQVDRLRRTSGGQRPTRMVNAAPTEPGAAAGRETPATRPPPTVADWESLFSSLEAAADESVTLLTLQPGANEIQISGEAKDFAASVDYMKRLESEPAVTNARLTQSEVVAENPRHPVRFALVAEWRGSP